MEETVAVDLNPLTVSRTLSVAKGRGSTQGISARGETIWLRLIVPELLDYSRISKHQQSGGNDEQTLLEELSDSDSDLLATLEVFIAARFDDKLVADV